MQKFEYRIVKLDHDSHESTAAEIMSALNKLGGAGWELVTIVPLDDQFNTALYYFKRPV